MIDRVTPDMRIAQEEVFGPVLAIPRSDVDDAIEVEHRSPYGNAASVFTERGSTARYVMERATAGMVGVNVGVPVPREPFGFGGWDDSAFGVGDITGRGSIEFWTRNRRPRRSGIGTPARTGCPMTHDATITDHALLSRRCSTRSGCRSRRTAPSSARRACSSARRTCTTPPPTAAESSTARRGCGASTRGTAASRSPTRSPARPAGAGLRAAASRWGIRSRSSWRSDSRAMLPASLDRVFFTNSGSEAVDTALKIALAYHRARGEPSRARFIGRERGYHGVGFGGISVGGIETNRKSVRRAAAPARRPPPAHAQPRAQRVLARPAGVRRGARGRRSSAWSRSTARRRSPR